MAKLKALRVEGNVDGSVTVIPVYFGKGGAEIRDLKAARKGLDVVKVAKDVLDQLLRTGILKG